jgi:hypothetical protein
MTLNETDYCDLKIAKNLLENPGLAARITDLIGTPIERALEHLPDNWNEGIVNVTQQSLMAAVRTAIFTMREEPGGNSSDIWHKIAVAITGIAGGVFGLPALALELPISTTIMLRSIADIARSEGENINDIDSKLACISVLALGGPSTGDDGAETGYFAVRAALARYVTEAAEFLARRGLVVEGAPVLIRFFVQISQRLSIQVTEKAMAQAIPIIGAATGALINTLFIDHFQNMAKGHFIVRRLERKYDQEIVKTNYENI